MNKKKKNSYSVITCRCLPKTKEHLRLIKNKPKHKLTSKINKKNYRNKPALKKLKKVCQRIA